MRVLFRPEHTHLTNWDYLLRFRLTLSITDGSARQVKFGEGKSITFRHSNDLGNFAYQSQLMQLAVLAMREIGEKTITEDQKGIIKNMITSHVSEQEFNHDIVLAPTWIKTILQR